CARGGSNYQKGLDSW
nr:immunoglobulin heavy chain junction region [Macaca mulatta]MOW94014.1 immunoglobulin heavy chain junction region [Macaca mulatta]MOW94895.1 immunoglobulin heavy chain junction region [Macaca mulatta]MOW95154.1 immunoglobulin heavy chain junction region [Macaca mulatta]MOW95996.1 immunoglobulin heavy chain junction region [Macaca mulatta]